jgi:hypothetical protein
MELRIDQNFLSLCLNVLYPVASLGLSIYASGVMVSGVRRLKLLSSIPHHDSFTAILPQSDLTSTILPISISVSPFVKSNLADDDMSLSLPSNAGNREDGDTRAVSGGRGWEPP